MYIKRDIAKRVFGRRYNKLRFESDDDYRDFWSKTLSDRDRESLAREMELRKSKKIVKEDRPDCKIKGKINYKTFAIDKKERRRKSTS
jgi:hypothetical protein